MIADALDDEEDAMKYRDDWDETDTPDAPHGAHTGHDGHDGHNEHGGHHAAGPSRRRRGQRRSTSAPDALESLLAASDARDPNADDLDDALGGDLAPWLAADELDAMCRTLANAASDVAVLSFALARPDLQPKSQHVMRPGVTAPPPAGHPRLSAMYALMCALFAFDDAVDALLDTLSGEGADDLPTAPDDPSLPF